MIRSSSSSDLSASSSARSANSSRSVSSWTPYIVDFMIHGNQQNQEKFSSSSDDDENNQPHTSSILSDAAKKLSNGNGIRARGGSPKRILNLKKRKTKVDEALEDTASSPINSPKVSGFKRQDMYPRKRDVHNSLNIEKPEDISEQATGESGSELKKKGLRLVPVSMVIKHQLA